MASLLLIMGVALLCILWVRANRLSRQRWLARLDLPGTWEWEGHDGALELDGDLDSGRYRLRDGDAVEAGTWRLDGHDLVLTPRAGGSSTVDVRLFTQGKIGIHGPGRERRIYVKKRGNVIPMRRPA